MCNVYRRVMPSEMQLGDVVMPEGEIRPWSSAVVKQVTNEEVTLFRPYGTSADFSYTGGVICWIGLEEYKISRSSSTPFALFSRKVLE